MKLIEDILKYKSLSVVGMGKNTGKTETMLYVLRNLPPGLVAGVTSVGTDGEGRDLVTGTHKPEIYLRKGTVFATAEKYYAARKLSAEILAVDSASTAAGRIVTARALTGGTAVISGPPTTQALARWISSLEGYGVGFTLVDGALGRVSSASPTVSESLILTTGAALSADMDTLIRETGYAVRKITLPIAERCGNSDPDRLSGGLWTVDRSGIWTAISGYPAFTDGIVLPEGPGNIFLAGALTERVASLLERAGKGGERNVIVADFTKIFLSLRAYSAFLRAGWRISVLRKSELTGITVNPVSPDGFRLDSRVLRERLAAETGLPVYDIMSDKSIGFVEAL